jgi:hypothetical protein
MLLPSTAEKYLSQQMGKAETALTLKNIVIAGLILMAADVLSTFILQILYPATVPSGTEPYLGAVTGFIDYALFFYVTAYVLYLVAKVLGGKGAFKEQLYLQSVVAVVISLIQGVLIVLASLYIPDDVLLLTIVSLPLLFTGMYSIYMDYKIIKVVHKHDSVKAALSIIGFWLAIFAVLFIIYAGLLLFTGQPI